MGGGKVLADFPTAHESERRYEALRLQYEGQGRKNSAIPAGARGEVWPLFLAYERARRAGRFYDANDLVADLYRRFRAHGRSAAPPPKPTRLRDLVLPTKTMNARENNSENRRWLFRRRARQRHPP